ncbi:MAG: transcription elongation factor GreA [Erysipelothrix sp.]|nr:transcription elongation factor GreA [Erysipelothrix sp.]
MLSKKVHVTKQGHEELKEERSNLIHVVRKEVIEELKAAREQGDLSENADYDAARERQGKVEARISELEVMLNNIEIIDSNKGTSKIVRLGSTVTLLDMELDIETTYAIVGSVEADPLNGKLSNETPLAQSLIGKKANETVTVAVEEPYEVKIIKIK